MAFSYMWKQGMANAKPMHRSNAAKVSIIYSSPKRYLLRRKTFIAGKMLQRFMNLRTRYLRLSAPNTSLPLTVRPRIRQISNTNPLRPSQARHIEDSLLDRLLDKYGINALIVLGGIVLPCLPFWWLEGRERERKDWISTLGAPSYKSWIKDTNLSSCQKDKSKQRHFKKAFATSWRRM